MYECVCVCVCMCVYYVPIYSIGCVHISVRVYKCDYCTGRHKCCKLLTYDVCGIRNVVPTDVQYTKCYSYCVHCGLCVSPLAPSDYPALSSLLVHNLC
jgi:hypothetical protein